MKRIKLALVCTIGGHFEQMLNLNSLYSGYEHFWVTNNNLQTNEALKQEKKYFIKMAHFKKPWEYLLHIPIFFKILFVERPSHIISTGSGRTALIPFLLSIVFDIPFIFIDTFSRVNGLSKMGKFIIRLHKPVYVQWEKKEIENTVFIGPVFENLKAEKENFVSEEKIIFVTLGTRKEQFNRLLTYIENLIDEGIVNKKVIVQVGNTKYNSNKFETFDFCSPEEIDNYIMKSQYIISQESAGLVTKCLKFKKKFIVVPREYKFKELPTQSDMEEDLHYKLEELGYTKVATNLNELKNAIKNINQIKTGFEFNNKLAIEILKTIIERKL